jgi:5'-nucleotidase
MRVTMPYSLTDKLVIGISSRALFDLEHENRLFDAQGVEAFSCYQREHEDEPLRPGTAFPLVQALLGLNALLPERRIEVVVISRNSPDTGLRAFNAIEAHGLAIERAAFTGGARSLVGYLKAFDVDLFLSRNPGDVQEAIDHGVAAALLYDPPADFRAPAGQIRIAFDGDAVLFSPESERIYKTQGLEAFIAHERLHRHDAMAEGPFAKLLMRLSALQLEFAAGTCPVRIAIVTARSSPAHARVIHTLRDWGVNVDEAFFLGGAAKETVLAAFGAQMFFDDQDSHVRPASGHVPAGIVPYAGGRLLPDAAQITSPESPCPPAPR